MSSEYPYGMMLVALVGLICAFLWAREPAPPMGAEIAPAVIAQPLGAPQYPAVVQGGVPTTLNPIPQPVAPPVQQAMPAPPWATRNH